MASHYEILGVTPTATADEIHRAYLDRARVHHPDQQRLDDDAAKRDAGEAMAELNEAWRVLGHPGRRRRYDRELLGEPIPTMPSTGSQRAGGRSEDDDLVDVVGESHGLFGFLPWLLVFGALAVIFVFTAYATTTGDVGDEPTATDSHLGECILITSGRPTVVEIDCAISNDGQVVEELDDGRRCPSDTRTLDLPPPEPRLCLAG